MVNMSDSATNDPTVTALLAMSEFFLTQRPLAVGEVARCLLAVLALQPVPRVEASVRLRLGLLLSEHTSCSLEAKEHLEKAMLVVGTAASLQEVRFHAASSLASLLATQGQQQQARGLLRGKLEATTHHSYWHIRLLLQLADLLSSERDVAGQLSVLSRCTDYCLRIGAGHAHLLATLARGAVLLTHHNYSEAGLLLNQASSLLEAHRGPDLPLLRTFYLTIQVTHLLMAGQVKTAKPHLKQLQQCVQTLSSLPEEKAEPVVTSDLSGVGRRTAEDFLWLTRHHAYITVYLVSVLHSVQAGLTDKALSYVERGLQLISQETETSLRPSGVLAVLRVHILEQSVQCLLMRGDSASAASQLQDLVDTCHAHPTLVYSHRAVLHTLLGLYAFATGNLDRAMAQLQTALQHTNCKELRILVSLNLAICFMKIGQEKEAELAALMTCVNSDGAGITCQSLQSALSYVRGLFSFTSGRLHDAKRQLRETLTVANAGDLNKLTSLSLLLLGQIFMALGNSKETLDMVTPALQLSVKMPDNRLQVWAASLLADLYHTQGEPEKEKVLRQQSRGVSHQLEQDQKKAVGSRTHQLVQWTIGEWPVTGPLSVEGRGQELARPCHTPPRRSSVTVNGSPLVLKTAEIVLKKVESPSGVTPPRSLLAAANKHQTTPPNSQAPPTHSQRRAEAEAGHQSQLRTEREWGRQREKTTERPSNHHLDGMREHQLMSGPTHQQSLHYHISRPPPNQNPPHPPPNQDTPPNQESWPSHNPTPRPLQSDSPLQWRPLAHPPTNQMSPRLHSSPTHHSFSHGHSPRLQSSPGHSPLAGLQQFHHLTPPQQPHFLSQEGKPHHLSALNQPPPSYDHTIQIRTPPHIQGSSPSGPHSPKLHHLSPSHTPPPSRIHTPQASSTHIPTAEQHLLQTQQRLLWEQKYLQAQQRMVQSGGYLQPLVPHPPGHGPVVAPHYMLQGLTPPQLSHMATLQQMGREPSRSHLAHALPGQPPLPSSLSPLHLQPSQHHRHGHQHR